MRPPSAVVIGATDLDATTAFLGRFGFVEAAATTIDANHARDVHGLDGPARTRLLLTPGARTGHLALVETPHAAPARGVFDHGPLALDVYTTDLAADLAELSAAGVPLGTPGRLELGPLVLRQVQVTAPDGWRLVLVEANHRRPTILDTVLYRGRHSQVHSQRWTVPSLEAASAAWIKAGFKRAHVLEIAGPELARILGLPRDDTVLRMNVLVGDEEDPVRVELVEFPGQDGAPEPDDDVLRAGVHALWCTVDDLDGPVTRQLTGARTVVTSLGTAVLGRLGGIRLQCWQAQPRPTVRFGGRRRR